jgi:hypothetical protein
MALLVDLLKLFIIIMIPSVALSLEEYIIIIQDHRFIPNNLTIPANNKVRLVVINKDSETEEFESFDLRREKIIPSNSQIKINIGPLKPGEYKFFGEFHSETAQGIITVK